MLENKFVLNISFNYPRRTPDVFSWFNRALYVSLSDCIRDLSSCIYHCFISSYHHLSLFIIIYIISLLTILISIKYYYINILCIVIVIIIFESNKSFKSTSKFNQNAPTEAHLLSIESSRGRSAQQGALGHGHGGHAKTMGCGHDDLKMMGKWWENEDEPWWTMIFWELTWVNYLFQ